MDPTTLANPTTSLLLIDSRLQDISGILQGLMEGVDHLLFDYATDTYDTIGQKITKPYKNIGIAQHNLETYTFPFLANEVQPTLCSNIVVAKESAETDVSLSSSSSVSPYQPLVASLKNADGLEEVDPEMASWQGFIHFLEWLRDERDLVNLDLLLCNVWSDPNWVYAINRIRSKCGIAVRASLNLTGQGGDFVLESDGVDMIGVYFTEAILQYQYAFLYDLITVNTGLNPYPNSCSLSLTDNGYGYCAGSSILWKTTDFGTTWTANNSLFAGQGYVATCSANGQFVVVGYNSGNGTFKFSNNYGVTFYSVSLGASYSTANLMRAFFNASGTRVVMAATYGDIVVGIPSGNTLNVSLLKNNGTAYSLAMSKDGNMVFYSDDNYRFYSYNFTTAVTIDYGVFYGDFYPFQTVMVEVNPTGSAIASMTAYSGSVYFRQYTISGNTVTQTSSQSYADSKSQTTVSAASYNNQVIVCGPGVADSRFPNIWYSLDGGSTINVKATPAVNGILAVAVMPSGQRFIAASTNAFYIYTNPIASPVAPTFASFTRGLNSLSITLNAVTAGYPTATNYLIATDASFNSVAANLVYPNTTVTLSSLQNQTYTFYSKAISTDVWSSPTDVSSATPYYLATPPTINSVSSVVARGNVTITNISSFTASQGGSNFNTCASNYNPAGNQLVVFSQNTNDVVLYLRVVNGTIGSIVSAAISYSGTAGSGYVGACAVIGDGTRVVLSMGSWHGSSTLFWADSSGLLNSAATNQTLTLKKTLESASKSYNGLTLSNDGSILLAGALEGLFIATWNGTNYSSFTRTLDTTTADVYSVTISADSSRIAYIDNDYIYWADWNGSNFGARNQVSITGGLGNGGRSITFIDGTSMIIFGCYNQNTQYTLWNGSTYGSTGTDINAYFPYAGSTTGLNSDSGGYVYYWSFGTSTVYVRRVQNTTVTTTVNFTPGTDGSPSTTAYYYTIDSSNSYINTGSLTSPFVITTLFTGGYHSIALKANAVANATSFDSSNSNTVSFPVALAGSKPTIGNVVTGLNSLTLNFSKSTGGYPDATNYLFAVDSSFANVVANVSSSVSTALIGNLLGQSYTIYTKAISGNVWSSAYDSSSATPYYAASDPAITTVDSSFQKLVVYFTDSSGGSPATSMYYVAVDSSASGNFIYSGSSSPITITGFLTSGLRTVYLKSVGNVNGNTTIWTSAVSSGTGQPYIVATTPNISSVTPGLNSLTVQFVPSSGGYPDPVTGYQYAFTNTDASFANTPALTNGNTFTVTGLTTIQPYTVYLRGYTPYWTTNVATSSTATTPYYVATAPTINSVSSVVTKDIVEITNTTTFTGPGGNNFNTAASNYNPTGNQIVVFSHNTNNAVSYLRVVNGTIGPIVSANVSYSGTAGSGYAAACAVIGNGTRVILAMGAWSSSASLFWGDSSGLLNSSATGQTLTLTKTLESSSKAYNGLTVSNDGSVLLAATQDGLFIATWNGTNYTALSRTLDTRAQSFISVTISIDGSRIAYLDTTYIYWADWNGSNFGAQTQVTLVGGLGSGGRSIAFIGGTSMIVYASFSLSTRYTVWNGITYNSTNTDINTYFPATIASTGLASDSGGYVYYWGYGTGTVYVRRIQYTPYAVSTTVNFTPGTNGSPSTTGYFYTIDSSDSYVNTGSLTSPFTITTLLSAGYHTIALKANAVVGSTSYDSSNSNTVTFPVALAGSIPNIANIVSGMGSLTVNLNPSVQGYPNVANYLVAYDASFTNVAANLTAPTTSVVLSGLLSQSYTFYAKATSGNLWATAYDSSSATPHYKGSDPAITTVDSSFQKLVVNFNTSSGGNPVANMYNVAVDSSASANFVYSGNSSPIVISGFSTAGVRTVYLKALGNVNSTTTAWSSNIVSASGQPYITGSTPTFQSVTPGTTVNTLNVTVNASTGGYPNVTNYLLAYDSNFTTIEANLVMPGSLSTTLSAPLNQSYRVYAKAISSNIWQTSSSISAATTPYYAGTAGIALAPVVSTLNALQLTFSTPVAGNPVANVYSYSLDGGNTYTTGTSSVVTVTNLPSAQSTVYATVGKLSIWTSPAVFASQSPYYKASDPAITTVDSSFEKLVVKFNASSGGNPTTSMYYVAVDSSASGNFIYSGTSSPITISGFLTSGTRKVYLKSVGNVSGTTTVWTSNIVSGTGQPYITGSIPTFQSVTPGATLNTLNVVLNASIGGTPDPTNYIIAYDALFANVAANLVYPNVSTTLTSLSNQSYTLYAKAISSDIWSTNANVSAATTPYYAGDTTISATPNIANVNTLDITLGGTDGNPPRTTFAYSLDGITYTNTTSQTFQVSSLENRAYTIYANSKSSSIWTSTTVNTTATPYYRGDVVVAASPILDNLNALLLEFTSPNVGNPAVTEYVYSVDGGNTYANTLTTSPNVVVSNLPNALCTIYANAFSGSTWATLTPYTTTATPYYKGSNPTWASISSGIEKLTVSYNASAGGNPTASKHYYAVDNSANWVVAPATSFDISGISVGGNHTVYLKAIGNVSTSTLVWTSDIDSSAGYVYIVGSAPTITNVAQSGLNELTVTFTPSTGGFPSVSQYQYAFTNVDGSFTAVPSLVNGNTFTLTGLTAGTYTVYLRGYTTAWTTPVASSTPTNPINQGSTPTFQTVTPHLNSLDVTLNASVNGDPAVTNHVIAFDASFTNIQANLVYPNLSTTLSPLLGQPYTLYVRAFSDTFWTSDSSNVTATPYNTGSKPNIQTVAQGINEFTVTLEASTGGVPSVSNYLLAYDASFADVQANIVAPNVAATISAPLNESYTIYAKAIGQDIWTSATDSSSSTPYYRGNVVVTAAPITNTLKALLLSFTSPNAGNPTVGVYSYSVDGGNTYATTSSSSVTVTNLPESLVSVYANASSTGGEWSTLTPYTTTSTPYFKGSDPVIVSLTSGIEKLTLTYTASSGGNPTATEHLYAVDNSANLVVAPSSPFDILNLTGGNHTVYLKSVGNVASTTTVWTSATDSSTSYVYVIGSAPTISNIAPGLGTLTVTFVPSTGGFPDVSGYQYAFQNVDGSFTEVPPLVNGNSFTLTGLGSEAYVVYLRGYNSVWTTPVAAGSTSGSYVTGSAPTFQSIVLGLNSLAITLSASAGGNPEVTNHEIAFDASFTDIQANLVYPNVSTTLSSLSNQQYTLYVRATSGTAWTSASNSASATPFYKGTATLSASPDAGNLNVLQLTFGEGSTGNPLKTAFSYSIDGNTYTETTDSVVSVSGLEPRSYTVYLESKSGNVWTSDTVSVSQSPYYVGGAPTIVSFVREDPSAVTSNVFVSLTDGSAGNPAITNYLYALDGSSVFVSTGNATVPFTIPNVDAYRHDVVVKAQSGNVWTSAASSTATLDGYYAASAPTINSVVVTTSTSISFAGNYSTVLGLLSAYPSQFAASCSDVSPKGKQMVIFGNGGGLLVWRIVQGIADAAIALVSFTFQPGESPSSSSVIGCAISADGTMVVVNVGGFESNSGYLYVGDSTNVLNGTSTTIALKRLPETTPRCYTSIALSADKTKFVTVTTDIPGHFDGEVFLSTWNAGTSNFSALVLLPHPANRNFLGVTMSRDGSRIAYTSNEYEFYWSAWDASNGTYGAAHTVTTGNRPGRSIAFVGSSADGLLHSTNGSAIQYFSWNGLTFGSDAVDISSNQLPNGKNAWGFCMDNAGFMFFAPYNDNGNLYRNHAVVQTNPNSIRYVIDFASGLTEGNPATTDYEYSIDGCANYVSLNTTTSPALLSADAPIGTHDIALRAVSSSIWASANSATYTYNTIVASSVPLFESIDLSVNAVTILLQEASGGTPAPTNYLIAYDTSFSNIAANLTYPSRSVVLSSLLNENYGFFAKAISGNVWSTGFDASYVTPYFASDAPTIQSVVPIPNTTVSFQGSYSVLNYSLQPYSAQFTTSCSDHAPSGTQMLAFGNGSGLFVLRIVNGVSETSVQQITLTYEVGESNGISTIIGCAISADGKRIVVAVGSYEANNGSLYFGDSTNIFNGTSTTLAVKRIPDTDTRCYTGIALTADKSRLVTVTSDTPGNFRGVVLLGTWDAGTSNYTQLVSVPHPSNRIFLGVAMTRDGSRIAYTSNTNALYWSSWNDASGTYNEPTTITTQSTGLRSVAFVGENADVILFTTFNGQNQYTKRSALGYSTSLTNVLDSEIPSPKNGWGLCVDNAGYLFFSPYGDSVIYTNRMLVQQDTQNVPLLMSFTAGATDGNPATTTYFYAVDGSTNYINLNSLTSPAFLPTAFYGSRSIVLRASSLNNSSTVLWNSADSASLNYNITFSSTTPQFSSIVRGIRELTLNWSASTGGYPEVTNYLIATDASFTNVLANVNAPSTTTVVQNLSNQEYTFYLKAIGGNTWTSAYDSSSATPYYVGSDPSIQSVDSSLNKLTVNFTASTGGNPAVTKYVVALDNSGNSDFIYSSTSSPIVLSDLPESGPRTVFLKALGNLSPSSSTVIWFSNIVSSSGQPYFAAGSPTIVQIDSSLQSLVVTVAANTVATGNPAFTTFLYSVNGGAYTQTGNTHTTIVVPDLFVASPAYTVRIKTASYDSSNNELWMSTASDPATGSPLIVGSPPVIANVVSAVNGLTVTVTPAEDMNPPPSAYLYSVDNFVTFGNTESNSTTFTIGNLTVAGTYSVSVKAVNSAGTTGPSLVSVSGEPYIKFSAPVIDSIQSLVNAVLVRFTAATDGYPSATYYYSLDGGAYTLSSNVASPLQITGLTNPQYTVRLKAFNLAGYSVASNPVDGYPYVVGSPPVISNIASAVASVLVYFVDGSNGNPSPSAYSYTINGGASFTTAVGTTSPITISGLNTAVYSNIAIKAINTAGTTEASNFVFGIPYLTGTAPVIANVVSFFHGLTINFTAPTNANPEPTVYYYSLNGGATFTLADQSATPLVVTGLSTATQANVCILANNVAGNTSVSNSVLATPWVVGTAPVISNVASQFESVVVSFTDSTGGYPAPTAYYYSLDGSTFTLATDVSNGQFTIANLTTATVYGISMFANNAAGNTTVSNTVSGEPWIIGSAPVIGNVESQLNSLLVHFTDGTGGYPAPTSYFYSLGDGNYNLATDVCGNVITIGNLNTPTTYNVTIFAENAAGNTQISNSVSGKPWIIGSAPVVSAVDSSFNSLVVTFADGSGGYPDILSYYYALDASATVFYDAASGTTPPTLVIGNLRTPDLRYVSLKARNAGGNTAVSNALTGRPYVISDPPIINSIVAGYEQLTVYFTDVNNGYPFTADRYYYSIDMGNTYTLANETSSPIIINAAFNPGSLKVYLISSNTAGNTLPAISDPFSPYVIGQPPVITGISSEILGLAVSFNAPVGGFPAPSNYLYSVDDGSFVDAGNVASPLHISGLTIAKSYSIRLKATNLAGTTAASDASSGTPYVVWGAPTIDTVVSRFHGFDVYFSESTTIGNPAVDYYYYTLNGGNTFTQISATGNYLAITGLSVAGSYTVEIKAHNAAGNSNISNSATGLPLVIGTAPNISSIDSSLNRIVINFAAGTGGYPSPSSYLYSLDNGTNYLSTSTTTSPIIISDLSSVATYQVRIKAVNDAGISPASDPDVEGRPWIIGTAPTIDSVVSGLEQITVNLTPGTVGYPNVSTYYYSLDGSNGTYYDSLQSGNALVITGLNTVATYQVAIKGYNSGGNTAPSNVVSGAPWIIGSTPVISTVDSSFQKLIINFSLSTGGYPDPTTYYYSLTGASGSFVDAATTSSPITVTGLTTPTLYSVVVKAAYDGGNTAASNAVSAKPWIIGSDPVIANVVSQFQSLVVNFSESTGGNPTPPYYFYSLNGSAGPFANSFSTSSPFTITGLTTATVYSVAILANNAAGNTSISSSVSGEPWIIGSAPNIGNVESQLNSLVVNFTAGTGGFPDPPTYYYSLNGASGPFVNSGVTSSPITITGLNTATVYSVAILGNNAAGNTQVSNSVSGEPWIIGSAPTIGNVQSQLNSLVVNFTAGTGGYPAPSTYYYSLNGASGPFLDGNVSASPLTITGLNTATVYSVAIKARNSGGNTAVSNTVSGEPWVVGTAPTIISVIGASGQITITFSTSTGAYPTPTYDYSLDGGNTFTSTVSTTSPIVVTGFTSPTVCNVQLRAVNSAGSILSTNTVVGQPLIIGSTPSIVSVASQLQSLVVTFNESTNGHPSPPTYYYSLNGASGPFVSSNSTSSPFTITGLNTATVYSVAILANYTAGNTGISNTVSGEPWIIGSAPTISSIDSRLQSMSVNFTAGTGGFPNPTTYYYSLTGASGSYFDGLVSSSPLVITGLLTDTVYSVAIKARNSGGNTAPSNVVSGRPLIIGSAPAIGNVESRLQSLVVNFTPGTGGYPDPPTYFYSLNGNTGPFANGVVTSSPLTITGLFSPATYSVVIFGNNAAGNTALSNAVSGQPWIIGSTPVIQGVDSSFQSIVIRFDLSTGGYPDPSTYYYSLYGASGTFIDANQTTSPIVVSGLTTSTVYNVVVKAKYAGGNTAASNSVSGQPLIIGSTPVISNVASQFESLVVTFSASTGGYPTPPYYYYSLNGSSGPFANSFATSSPFTISGLNTATTYSVAVLANNAAGNTSVSNAVSGTPWVIGTAPTIDGIDSSFQKLVVRFTPGTGGYPNPTTYYYSLTGASGTYTNGSVSTSPLIITGLTTATTYSVAIKAQNSAGNTAPSNVVNGQPWIVGSAPLITDVSSIVNGLMITFNNSTGANPTPYYWYSLDSGNTYANASVTSSPITVTGLSTYATYTVSVKAVNAAGNIASSNTLTGKPYVVGSAPSITGVTSQLNALQVGYSVSADTYPAPVRLYYTAGILSGYVDISATSGAFVIGNLAQNSPYTITIKANNVAGNTASSASASGTPYLIGTAPVVSALTSIVQGFQVDFSGSLNGNPAPTAYYYTVNGGNSFALASGTTSPIVITDSSFTAQTYTVGLIAQNLVGNTQLSNLLTGVPLIVGSAPTITLADEDVNSLVIYFTAGTGGNPAPTTYYYNLDNGPTWVNANTTTSPFTINGLLSFQPFTVRIKAENAAGNTVVSNAATGTPIIAGTTLVILRIESLPNAMSIVFDRTTAGTPANGTNYFYSLNNGATFVNSGQNATPVTITGFTSVASYQVILRCINNVGKLSVSNTVQGQPYIQRSAPVITSVTSLEYGLEIAFDDATGGYPAETTTFYVSLDGGATYTDVESTVSPIIVVDLFVAGAYPVVIKAMNLAGLSPASNTVIGYPYVVAAAPSIRQITTTFDTATLEYGPALGGYPAIASYQYSIDNGVTFVDVGLSLVAEIRQLTDAQTLTVTVRGVDLRGVFSEESSNLFTTQSLGTFYQAIANSITNRNRPIFIGAQPKFIKLPLSTVDNTETQAERWARIAQSLNN